MNKHNFEIVKKIPKLQFCTYCKTYIRDAHFRCSQAGCNEFMCLRCSGGVDTSAMQPGMR